MRMRNIVICVLPGSQYFSTFSHKRFDFRQNNVLNVRRVFDFLYNILFSETYLFLRISQHDTVITVHRSFCEVPDIHVRLYGNSNFLVRFSKNNEI